MTLPPSRPAPASPTRTRRLPATAPRSTPEATRKKSVPGSARPKPSASRPRPTCATPQPAAGSPSTKSKTSSPEARTPPQCFANAEPAQKADAYDKLGLRLTYDPDAQIDRATANPQTGNIGKWFVSEGGWSLSTWPPCDLRGRS